MKFTISISIAFLIASVTAKVAGASNSNLRTTNHQKTPKVSEALDASPHSEPGARAGAIDTLQANHRQLATTQKTVDDKCELVFGAFWQPEGCDSYGSGSFSVTKGTYEYDDYEGSGSSPYSSISISMTLWSECSGSSEKRTTIEFEGDFSDTPGRDTFTIAQQLKSALFKSTFNSKRTVAVCEKTCSPVSGHCDIGDCNVVLEDFQPLTFRSNWKATDTIMNTTETFTESGRKTYTSRTTTGQSVPASIAGKFKLNGVVLDFDPDLNGVISKSKTVEISKSF